MGTKQPFKTYERGQRIQDTNITFASGMSFTNAPLEEGFSRLLVNYDFGENGLALKPRRGMQTSEALYTSDLKYISANGINASDDMSIVAGSTYTFQNKTYYQIIIGRITDFTNQRYIGDAWVLTCYQGIVDGGQQTIVHYSLLNSPDYTSKCYFSKPNSNEVSIHGLAINKSNYIKKHIGAFAFNGSYYYFCTDEKLYYTKFNEETLTFEPQVVTPYEPYQAETQNSLYNMLLEEPYKFSNKVGLSNVLRLTGFMPCVKKGNELETKLQPQSGVRYTYKMYYEYPEVSEGASNEYCFHIEYNTGLTDTWYPIDRDESEPQEAGNDPFKFEDIRVDSSFAQFRIFAIAKEKAAFTDSKQLTLEALANSVVLTASFSYAGSNKSESTNNTDLVRYDLSNTNGIVYWKNRLWLFGAKDRSTGVPCNNILFASDVNRPDWFPYTANADIFDEDIIYVQPMLDDLLVFTTHNLFSLTLDTDGLSWTRKHLQTNLNISSWDLNLIQIVKNMVFFKSGNYYYMVVPKLTAASGAGLAIAPVSKSITYFLDNFKTNVDQIIDDLYNYSCYTRFGDKSKITFDLELVHYYNYLDYEDVHNNYVFKVNKREKTGYNSDSNSYRYKDTEVYLNFELLYNTVKRTWRIYTIESQRLRHPLFMNATGKGKYVEMVADNTVNLQFLEYSNISLKDRYIKQNSGSPEEPSVFNNWQYLDTGNLNQNSDIKKRFREYQFKIYNITNNPLKFYSGFILDKGTRTYNARYSYTDIDELDSDSMTLVIEAHPDELQGVPTVYNSSLDQTLETYDYTILGYWMLGTSAFPSSNTWKIRVPTSGKGYLPRIILVSYNSTDYELLSCATVYRQLYSR